MTSVKKSPYEEELKKNDADSYAAYLAQNGIKSKDNYLDALASAQVSKELSDIRRGSIAESLYSSGLSNSGYADYLQGINEDTYNKKVENAKREKAISEYKNTSGYEKYLSDYEKIQTEISKSFVSSFGKGDVFDFEEAYKQAISAGLNETFAISAATQGIDAAINNAIERSITFAKINSLSASSAKEYAKSLGLHDVYAEKVYKAVYAINGDNATEDKAEYSNTMTPEEYYQYIINKKSK